MNDNLIIKKTKKRNKSKDILMSFNIINLSNQPSLKDMTDIQKIKLKNNNSNAIISPNKINIGINTVYSIIKKLKNKNKHNYYNVKKKKNFPDIDGKKYEGDYETTIRSNGKFLATQNLMKFVNKNNKIFVNTRNRKKIIHKNTFKNREKHELINNEKKNKQTVKEDWKGLNISSHYLGNTFNNKFGITSNKFYINKDLILLHSKNN